ncbi:MAG: valine--tRNA ligase [Bacilli bacterium]
MLEKKYDHLKVEKDKYNKWLENNYFKAGDTSKEPFCIVIPPPNVTGKLHLGHAWDTTLQDIIIRYKRMKGFDALWLPGMDHAGIATQAKVDQKLKNEGINPREMNRDEWLKTAWSFKKEYASIIRSQWAKLGLGLDYSRERFTLDEGLNKAVNKVFIDLYNKGLIYRGERIINFDPVALTALSNIEVIYKEVEGAFYHLKYMIEDSDDFLEIATTRPETLFGDTAVAVNPKDKRYKDLIGKNVILPIVNKKIPIIGDYHADMEFGTGVVKITPAHDPNDFEVGNRHNLDRIIIMNTNATMNENCGIYNGLDRFVCREKLLKDLDELGLLISIKKIKHNVGFSERTNVMVEPFLSKQWFVKMDVLANNALDNQKTKEHISFIPKRFEHIFANWMENIQDWCISRQLWWGHRIPAWYKNEEIKVQIECPGEGWNQDNDVLDTWFSSALWPFSTLGFPDKLETRYFPNDVLVTGYDIIFFWVSRMIFQSLEFTKLPPFKEVLIHGLIRDKEGRKMSKSLGNGIDPMDVIDEYGADALRYFLTTNTSVGQDLRYDEEKVKSTWNFINKLWNASRFVLLNLEDIKIEELNNLTISDKWILTKLNETIKIVTKNMDKYEFQNVGTKLYQFIWEDFCDNYIELSKANMNNTTKNVLLTVLTSILKMLHPFMPYVTDEIYESLGNKENITISNYPVYNKKLIFKDEALIVDKIILDITSIRNMKVTNNITKDSFIKLESRYQNIFISQLKIKEEQLINKELDNYKSINYTSNYINITYYFIGEELDLDKINEEIHNLQLSINKRKKLLENENYIQKAPSNIVKMDRIKLIEEEDKLTILLNKIDNA